MPNELGSANHDYPMQNLVGNAVDVIGGSSFDFNYIAGSPSFDPDGVGLDGAVDSFGVDTTNSPIDVNFSYSYAKFFIYLGFLGFGPTQHLINPQPQDASAFSLSANYEPDTGDTGDPNNIICNFDQNNFDANRNKVRPQRFLNNVEKLVFMQSHNNATNETHALVYSDRGLEFSDTITENGTDNKRGLRFGVHPNETQFTAEKVFRFTTWGTALSLVDMLDTAKVIAPPVAGKIILPITDNIYDGQILGGSIFD